MKYLFFLLIVISSACNKNEEFSDSLIGSWELRLSKGGLMPDKSYNPDNGNILKFADSSFQSFASGQLVSSGSYIKSKGQNPQTGEVMDAVTFNHQLTAYYKIDKDTMTLYVGILAADGVIQKYVRQ